MTGSATAETWLYEAVPSTPTITDLPTTGYLNSSFVATVATTGDGTTSVTSSTTSASPSGPTG